MRNPLHGAETNGGIYKARADSASIVPGDSSPAGSELRKGESAAKRGHSKVNVIPQARCSPVPH